MTAIAGIQYPKARISVKEMLDSMRHRGHDWQYIIEKNGVILGAAGYNSQSNPALIISNEVIAQEKVSKNHYARAITRPNGLELTRDPLGISPLYYGKTREGALCFASEVKGLLTVTRDIHELPPGYTLTGSKLRRKNRPVRVKPIQKEVETIAKQLRVKIESSVTDCISNNDVGAWLSGGIDSTAIAAIARPNVKELHTFTIGLAGSQDVHYASIAAKHIGSNHHSRLVTTDEIISIIPDVIYHLESFDALLIRSSLLNFLVAKMAADYVPAVFSGEGADELFAGYEYLHQVPMNKLQGELSDILMRLHNTALQRVDRSAAAHGLVAYLGLLDQDIVELAQQIPVEYKIRDGVEKWILRKAVEDLLPEALLMRKKAKFWQGGGVQESIAEYAKEEISDRDFISERKLKNGETLNSKEELLYYRIFRAHFGEFEDLAWMGRTKGAPVN